MGQRNIRQHYVFERLNIQAVRQFITQDIYLWSFQVMLSVLCH